MLLALLGKGPCFLDLRLRELLVALGLHLLLSFERKLEFFIFVFAIVTQFAHIVPGFVGLVLRFIDFYLDFFCFLKDCVAVLSPLGMHVFFKHVQVVEFTFGFLFGWAQV